MKLWCLQFTLTLYVVKKNCVRERDSSSRNFKDHGRWFINRFRNCSILFSFCKMLPTLSGFWSCPWGVLSLWTGRKLFKFRTSKSVNICSIGTGYFEQGSSGVLCKSSQPPCLCDLSSAANSVAVFPILSAKPSEGAGFDSFSKSLRVAGIIHQPQSCEGACWSCASSFRPKPRGKLPKACREPPGTPARWKCRYEGGVIESARGVLGQIWAVLVLGAQMGVFIRGLGFFICGVSELTERCRVPLQTPEHGYVFQKNSQTGVLVYKEVIPSLDICACWDPNNPAFETRFNPVALQ